jgi:hypothetical protein
MYHSWTGLSPTRRGANTSRDQRTAPGMRRALHTEPIVHTESKSFSVLSPVCYGWFTMLRCLRAWASLSATAILLWLPIAAPAQRLTFGVVAGTSLTGDFKTGTYHFPGGTLPDGQTTSSTWTVLPFSRSLVIGPKLELALPRNFSLELDALHRALHSKQSMTEFFSGGSRIDFGPFTRTHASWEFPLLAKYRLSNSPLHPFFEAGPSLRPAGTGTNLSHWGPTAGAGIELHAHGFNISPAIRFTHWKAYPGSVPVAIQNQVEFLVGLDQRSESGWATGFGKRLSVGILAGIGLGDDLKTATTPSPFFGGQRSDSNSPIVGALLEFAIYRSLALEANGIYRALHATDLSTMEGDVRFAVLTWEFPVMAKYKFRESRAWQPFVELGPSFRLDGNFNGPTPSHYGVAVGAGVQAHLGRLKISPAIRYTRWGEERSPQGGGTFRNEVETLIGLSF